MNALRLRPAPERQSGSCTVRIRCGNLSGADVVTSIDLYSENMGAMEAHALVTKALGCAARTAGDVHSGDTLELTIARRRDD